LRASTRKLIETHYGNRQQPGLQGGASDGGHAPDAIGKLLRLAWAAGALSSFSGLPEPHSGQDAASLARISVSN
jgi:hypothetical protein